MRHDPKVKRNATALGRGADDRGARFEPAAFGELVEFIEEMPF